MTEKVRRRNQKGEMSKLSFLFIFHYLPHGTNKIYLLLKFHMTDSNNGTHADFHNPFCNFLPYKKILSYALLQAIKKQNREYLKLQ